MREPIEVPEPWATAMIEAGLVDSRYKIPRPSLNKLRDAARKEVPTLHTTTLSSMVRGSHVTNSATRAAVARALRRDIREVSRWVDEAQSEVGPYRPPEVAVLLTAAERRAIDGLIVAITKDRRGSRVDGR